MKHLIILSLFALHSSIFTLSAAIPVPWTVDMRRAQPATFEEYQGETLDFKAALMLDGKPFEAPSNYSFFWQTNGMGRYYWSRPVSSSPSPTNVLFATWLPEYDCGARVYNCFIGSPSNNYHSAFQLRLRPSPGATPNELPLPQKVIDFAKVTVLNPPWSGGGGGGVDTNAVKDIVRPMIADATNGIRSVDGAARPLPRYLHALDFDDSYPEAAKAYYDQRQGGGVVPSPQCSSVRDGGFLYRNFDYPFDDRAEFVVKMSAGKNADAASRRVTHRFASVGVAQVGTNLTEHFVVSGKPSRCYKWLPGATVDGINENGVACNINVVSGSPSWGGGVSPALHPLAAVRWILDNATNAQHAATYIASHISFPEGWTQNFHYMIADERETWIVENGTAYQVTNGVPAMTNFRLYPTRDTTGEGQERYIALTNGANITSQWWTLTYTSTGYRASDLPGITGEVLTSLFKYWENNPRESHRGERFGNKSWLQTVHTSVYDLTNRVLRVAVQETDDWYIFAVDQANVDLSPIEAQIAALQDGKLDKTERAVYETTYGPWTITGEWGPESDYPKPYRIYEIFIDQEWFYELDDANGSVLGFIAYTDRMTDISFYGLVSATRTKSSSEKSNQQLAAVATGDAQTPANGDIVKYDAANDRFIKALAETDYLKTHQDISGKLDNSPGGVLSYLGAFWKHGLFCFGNIEYHNSSIEIEPDVGIITSMQTDWSWLVNSNNKTLQDDLNAKADRETTLSGYGITDAAPLSMISATDPTFSNAVLAVQIDTNTVAQIGELKQFFDDLPTGTVGTSLGGIILALLGAAAYLKKKTALLKSDGTAEDDFAADLLGKQVAKIPLEIVAATESSFNAVDGHAYSVAMPAGGITINFPTVPQGTTRAWIFQCRFANSGSANANVSFNPSGSVIKFDGADCGIVKAGKDALLSAMWNGEAWDLVWKNQA